MNGKPLVSVIIPAYNARDTIVECLDSVLAQTYQHLEVIVVDDGSTDDTAQIVQKYAPRVLYCYQDNSGGCAVPRNTGIKRSTGDFLCFVDADDLIAPGRIARQVAFMQSHPDVGTVFCDYQNFDEVGSYKLSHFQTCTLLWPRLMVRGELIVENGYLDLARENFGIAGTFLVRRNTLLHESGFYPALKACEDFHLYYRLARRAPIGIVNEVGMFRRLHGNNMSGDPWRMLTEGIRSRTLLRDGEQDSQARALLSAYITNCHNSLARFWADQGQYRRALVSNWRALVSSFSLQQLMETCRSFVRIAAIAASLHKP